jgi:hypothetical protein
MLSSATLEKMKMVSKATISNKLWVGKHGKLEQTHCN